MAELGRSKQCWLFNADSFHAVSAKCKGRNSKHKHAAWGLDKHKKKFATGEGTAYTMGLARMLANCIVMTLMQHGIRAPEETLQQLQSTSLKSLQQMKAATGIQPKASRIPPLVPTCKSKNQVTSNEWSPPSVSIASEVRARPSGERYKQSDVANRVETSASWTCQDKNNGGCGAQSLPPIMLGVQNQHDGKMDQILQTWGSPWSPMEFVRQAAKAGHPLQLDSCLPSRPKVLTEKFRNMSLLDRVRHRIGRTKFLVDRMAPLKSDQHVLKQSMRQDVKEVLADKNIFLWKEVVTSIGYEDMGVVDQLMHGSSLVGAAPATGLWPSKNTPATMSVDDLYDTAKHERTQGVKVIDMDDEMLQSVWSQTLGEVQAGFLTRPIDLQDVPGHIPLSKRSGVRQGAKIRCVDDFSRSRINGCEQVSESPKPHKVDIIA